MKLIIIGGGIAGLSAGIYACQSGIDTTIYEMHSIPGGNSTGWRRKGYYIEGGMHWLNGSGEKTPLYQLWKETGALQENNPVYNRDPFLTYMGEGGPICLYRDPEKLREHLLSISPEDKDAILSLIRDIKVIGNLSMPVANVRGVKTKRKMAPPFSMLLHLPKALPCMKRLSSMSTRAYIERFRHKGIRTLLMSVCGDDMAATAIAFTLASLSTGDSGYPKGGALRMAQNMADTFLSLGGTLYYGKKVQQIIIEDGKAAGIRTEDGIEQADAFIIASDTRTAIDSLFEQPLDEPWMDIMRRETAPVSCTFVSIGVSSDLGRLPENLIYPLKKPLQFMNREINAIGFNHYANFEGYAPDGCTVLTCILLGDTYDEWKEAQENGTYTSKKQELADAVIALLAESIPETAGKVEMWDIATPLTYERYCGTWRGSWMSVLKPSATGMPASYPLCSETIQNLYFAGQRMLAPGGLPTALTTGRQAVQYLCRDADIIFQNKYI